MRQQRRLSYSLAMKMECTVMSTATKGPAAAT